MPATEEVLAKVRGMEEVAKKNGVSLAAPALQFALRDPLVSSVLIGTGKASSVTRNMDLVSPILPETIYPEFDSFTLVAPPLGDDAVRV
jgi:D-threo-aldose 1-dehydrogenase